MYVVRGALIFSVCTQPFPTLYSTIYLNILTGELTGGSQDTRIAPSLSPTETLDGVEGLGPESGKRANQCTHSSASFNNEH